ncbi:extensin family protein [Caldimonas brevitalea]|uniref:Extensin n=1 Tax=Caldimonas brevitalea TaxID=413882 RepID=A0A0G3BFG7_9BURK|nr:extensin family protein [Caldimonas brevitalea]AKJ28194.1 extensin [Caldimonas brevitalea]
MAKALSFLLGLALLLGMLVAAGAYALREGHVVVPAHWRPWAAVTLTEPPGPFTRFKLARLERDPALCRSVLATTPLVWRPLPDTPRRGDCGWRNAVQISATESMVKPPFPLSCRAAVALALWEHHVLQPAAQRHFGMPVRRIEHLGSYACRNVYGRDTGPRSQHASADALDIAGFVLQDGRRLRVLRHWDEAGPAGRLLREVHQGACRYFDGALGPEYNQAHRDHLHLDRGGPHVCR